VHFPTIFHISFAFSYGLFFSGLYISFSHFFFVHSTTDDEMVLDYAVPLVVEALLALISLGCLGLLAVQPFKNPPPISLRYLVPSPSPYLNSPPPRAGL
jgi:ABC-type Fe3+-siderophore transport system permease subunit